MKSNKVKFSERLEPIESFSKSQYENLIHSLKNAYQAFTFDTQETAAQFDG